MVNTSYKPPRFSFTQARSFDDVYIQYVFDTEVGTIEGWEDVADWEEQAYSQCAHLTDDEVCQKFGVPKRWV